MPQEYHNGDCRAGTGRAVYLPLLNRSGLNCRVIEGRTIRPGDPVTPA
ncbi:MAG: hypothetical protein ACU0B1_07225 [Thermohalobaculum sp.]